MPLLVPIAIFSSIILFWIYFVTSLVVGLFSVFSVFLIPAIIISLIGGLFFIIGIIGANMGRNRGFQLIYTIGAIWLGAVTIAGMLGIVLLLIAEISNISYDGYIQASVFAILVIVVNMWAIYASWSARVQRYEIKIDKKHLWHGRSIVLIADTHYGNIYRRGSARRLVEKINTLQADIVLIAGDFFDGPPIDYLSIVKEFSHIRAKYGILFANGNHEEYRNTPAILDAMRHPMSHIIDTSLDNHVQDALHRDETIRVINNEKIEIDGVIFSGVTYHDTETSEGLIEHLDRLDLDEKKPNILLKHKPTLHTILESYPIDLVVSGHTHRAQMWPFSIATYIVYGKYVYGRVTKNGLTSITTSGVGTWGPPQRVGTRSEIVVLDII